ncbi:hypothetical protein D3C87_2014560 [compost metagenome]
MVRLPDVCHLVFRNMAAAIVEFQGRLLDTYLDPAAILHVIQSIDEEIIDYSLH